MLTKFIALAALGAALAPAAASATTITFGGATGTSTSYTEQGYQFTSSSLVALDGALGNGVNSQKITVSRSDNALFTIASLDVASQIGMLFANNMDVLFDFVLANGSTTSDYRVIDLGQNPTFSTISDFGDMQLRSFRIYSDTNSGTGLIKIDNLVVNAVAAVPEPASWALMIGGLGVAGLAARRRRVAVRFA